MRILHSASGAQHPDHAERRRRQHDSACWSDEVPARSGHAAPAARRFLPRQHGAQDLRSPCRSCCTASRKGVKQQAASSSSCTRKSKSSACPTAHSGAHRRRRQRARRRPGRCTCATSPPTSSWTPLSDTDLMLVHVVGTRSWPRPRPRAPTAAGWRRRARSGQEGQDRQGSRRQGQAEEVKLVVGLGNPGARYEQTRHNVGFQIIDELARRWHVDQWRNEHQALVARVRLGDEAVLVAKPMTFMNLSGDAVAGIVGFYKMIRSRHRWSCSTKWRLPLGRLRAGRGGSDGGHNGLKSIIGRLGTQRRAAPAHRRGPGRRAAGTRGSRPRHVRRGRTRTSRGGRAAGRRCRG